MFTVIEKVQELMNLIEGTGTRIEIDEAEGLSYAGIIVNNELVDELLREDTLITLKKGKQTLVCKEYNNIWVCTERK